ncbi:MAG: 30S ribosomal protein S16 [Patescibacteria group bacterium]
MPVTIRLMRFGKKGHPTYRVVVLDKRKKAVGSYIEKIGTYNPMKNPAEINIDKTLLDKWRKKGAVVSDGVRKLLHLK